MLDRSSRTLFASRSQTSGTSPLHDCVGFLPPSAPPVKGSDERLWKLWSTTSGKKSRKPVSYKIQETSFYFKPSVARITRFLILLIIYYSFSMVSILCRHNVKGTKEQMCQNICLSTRDCACNCAISCIGSMTNCTMFQQKCLEACTSASTIVQLSRTQD